MIGKSLSFKGTIILSMIRSKANKYRETFETVFKNFSADFLRKYSIMFLILWSEPLVTLVRCFEHIDSLARAQGAITEPLIIIHSVDRFVVIFDISSRLRQAVPWLCLITITLEESAPKSPMCFGTRYRVANRFIRP